MAYPPAYTRTASFTEFEELNPGEPKPGVDLDTEFDNVSNALTGTQDNLALIQRADGALANESVGPDQLQADLFDGIGDAATADAEAAAAAAAASAAAAATSAANSAASATAASTDAAVAAGSAAQAAISQGVAQTAAIDAGSAADDAGDAADAAELAANTTANSVAQAQLHEEMAFKWAEYLAAPVAPAPPGWPEAVDDGMFSAKWWALRARDYNTVYEYDFGTAGADIGEAFDIWDAIPGNDLPPGQVFATWGTPPHTYVLTDPSDPSNPDSWTDTTGGPGPAGPPNTLTIGTVTSGVPTSATITGTSPNQVLNLVIEPGATGATGATGPAGATGAAGPPNTLSIGTVTTGAPGSSASASITGAAPSQTLSLTIPRGDVGATGATGATGPAGPTNYVDPTGTIGLTVVNGVATTTMRSDAAPPLSQAIVPIWTGAHTFNATVDLAGPVEASGVEGLNGQVLASQGAGLPLVFRNAGSGSIELGYNFAVAVGTADPGNQKLSLNSAVYASVNQIQFDDLAFGNFDATTILSLLTSGNRIYIQARADATRAVVYEVTGVGTDNGGHWSIPVSIIASRGALFAANSDLTCVFILSSSSIAVANPTGTIGLTAVNGSATTALRSDGAPALSQAISPTWTGAHTWSNTTPTLTFVETDQAADETKWKLVVSGRNFTLRAYSDSESSSVSFLTAARGTGTAMSSVSFGDSITSPNYNFLGTGTATFNGAIVGAGATGGAQGVGTVNATGLYINGVAVSTGGAGSVANPTATIGLTAVNGVATSAIRSDGAPALSQAIVPTWTGTHTWSGAAPELQFIESDRAADEKLWHIQVNSKNFGIRSLLDASAGSRNALLITRGTGMALTTFAFGNATDNPSYSFLGTGAITSAGVFLGPNGAFGAPTFSFSADTDTGMFLNGVGAIGLSTAGATRVSLNSTALNCTVQYWGPNGLVGAPTYSFANDTNTGLYWVSADIFAVSCGGVISTLFSAGLVSVGDGQAAGDRIRLRTSAATAAGTSYHHYLSAGVSQLDMYAYDGAVTTGGTLSIRYAKTWFADGVVGTPAISFAADPDTGIYRTGANSIGFAANGVQQAIINASGSYFADGTAALPGISFLTDGDTGIYRAAANTIGFAALAAVRMTLSDTALVASVPVQIANGTNAAPSFAFSGDTDTGIYFASSNMIGFASGGSTGATLSRGALVLYGNAAGATNNAYVELRDSASTLIGYLGDISTGDSNVSIVASVAGANITLTPGTGGTVNAPSYTTTSSRAIKRETGSVRSARDILAKLRPLLYRLLGEGEPEQLGLIAEEVQEVCPQLSNGKAVAYDRLAILLLAAWQEEHA